MTIDRGELDGTGRVKIHPALLWALGALLGWAISAYAGYTAASSAMNARVSVLETQYLALHADLQEIKADVKELIRRP